MYGKEIILDLHGCALPVSREDLERFCVALCELAGMERAALHFWDYEGDPEGYAAAADHLKGISLVQFITTSNITVHTIDVSGQVLINFFSCKDFDADVVERFCSRFFGAGAAHKVVVERGQ